MVPADSDRISRVPTYSGYPNLNISVRVQDFHLLWRDFPDSFRFQYIKIIQGPATPYLPKQIRFGLFPVRSPLLGESLFCFLFLRVLRCFSSPGSPPDCSGYHAFNVMGCPIRKPADIMDICSSPQLIAACHVLLRLREPRHPPCALNYFLEYNLTNFSFYFSQYVKEPLSGFTPNP